MDKILYFDICAIIILIVLLYSTFSRKVVQGRMNKLFIVMLLLSGISAICDIWSEAYGIWLPVDQTARIIREILVYGYFLSHTITPLVYILYLISITDTWYKVRESLSFKLALIIPYAVVLAALFVNIFTHAVFYINDDCQYVRNKGIYILYISAIVYMCFGIVYIWKHRRLFTSELFIALIAIFPMEFTAVVIQFFFPKLLVEIFITVVANMLIMINIQRPEENVDQVVGARNYYAYRTDLKRGLLNQKKMGIIIVKIINYRSFYSVLGYDAYNKLLRNILHEITMLTKKEKVYTDMYYIDGGRFVLMLDSLGRKKANTLMVKIDALLKESYLADSMDIAVESSICYLRYPEDIRDFKKIISFGEKFHKLVENPLGIIHAEEIDARDFNLNNEIDKIVMDALQNKKFEMYYQPIYSIKEEKFISAEALIRLNDEKFGFISPELLVSTAEKNGVIHQIGEFVVNSVCEFIQSEEFKETGLEYIELNISAVEYMQANLAERIINTVKNYNVSPSQINLEITETAFVSSESAVMENINKLSEAGFTFSLDDYGTGYSNIQRVISLPLKIVKMDKSFVDEIENPRVYGVVKNTIKMLKEMHIEIVVEGVEIDEVAQEFVDLRCDYIQGYYYSRPIPKDEFVEFCKTH